MRSRLLIVGFLLLGIPLVSGAGWAKNMVVKLKKTNLIVNWNVDWTLQQVELDVRYSGRRPAWILVGFSDHGKIEGSDGCLYTGDQRVLDVHLTPSGRIETDRHQDCRLRRSNPKNMHFRFTRKFATCDPRDYAIEVLRLLISSLDANCRWERRTSFSRSERRRSSRCGRSTRSTWCGRTRCWIRRSRRRRPPPAEHFFELDVVVKDVVVPSVVTTYWCQVMKLDARLQSRKHHAIRYEAVITPGNEHLVHHMELFHCRSDPGQSYGGSCDSPMKPSKAKGCSQVLAAWAMNAPPVVYPEEAGMPLGGEDFVPYLMIEIHYNNVHNEAGVRDHSGFRSELPVHSLHSFSFQSATRTNCGSTTRGIMELGLIYSDANSIPPGQPSFPITGHCVADCTRYFPKEGIKIFATQLHAHLTGRKLFTSHFRDGVKIGEINRDNHYSPHWQTIRSLLAHVHVLPGDVLSTTCVYDTTERSNWTWGGYEIESEMCVNYIHFYPAAEVEVCKSAISNRTLDRFFQKYLGESRKNLRIHERYLRLPQKQKLFDAVHEWYATEPLNMACLDHSGELVKDPSVDWSHVQRPEVFAGIYDRSGARAECPAINT
ncbi:hypothetical protein M3Y99_00070700 [Aphelenchoides fujianensis]|nr:hypothetical protein M3Y99_00070700 [Aphelenchoides fujianensis]